MKKLFFTATLVLSLFLSIDLLQAQLRVPTVAECTPITTGNYPTCCPANPWPGLGTMCVNYKAQVCSNNSTDPICQTIRGGTPNTNPTNSGGNQSVITPTPQASSAILSSCSAIKFNSLLDILVWLKCVIAAAIIPLIFTLAFLYFLWGMVMFIKGADDVKKREESKKFIYWGIIGLTVMVAVWGIVQIVTSTFGLGNAVPTLQTKDNCLTTDKNNPCK